MKRRFEAFANQALGSIVKQRKITISPDMYSATRTEKHRSDADGAIRWNTAAEFLDKKMAGWKPLRAIWSNAIDAIASHAKIKPTDHITELGSGLGVHGVFIAKEMVPHGKVVCIDYAEEMVTKAFALAKKAQVKNIEFRVANAKKTGLPNASQDKVLMVQLELSRGKGYADLLTESRRILKNDGRVLMIGSRIEGQRLNNYKEILLVSGLEIEKIVKMPDCNRCKVRLYILKPKIN